MEEYRKIEFDLKVRKSKDVRSERRFDSKDDEPEWEVYEELGFKTLSAKEVLRKLIDYLK